MPRYDFIKGEKVNELIGRRGETLDALQYLISLFVNKKPRLVKKGK